MIHNGMRSHKDAPRPIWQALREKSETEGRQRAGAWLIRTLRSPIYKRTVGATMGAAQQSYLSIIHRLKDTRADVYRCAAILRDGDNICNRDVEALMNSAREELAMRARLYRNYVRQRRRFERFYAGT